MFFTLDICCFFWFCSWRYRCNCWCVSCRCRCSIFIFHLYCRWIWCSYEVFVWSECYFTSCWINCVCSNLFSIFCRWNCCIYNRFPIYYELSWLLWCNCDWCCFITLSERWCSFLCCTLNSSCFFWFRCWSYWCYCWCVSSLYFCSVSIFRYNFNWFWCSYEVFVRLECKYSSFWI